MLCEWLSCFCIDVRLEESSEQERNIFIYIKPGLITDRNYVLQRTLTSVILQPPSGIIKTVLFSDKDF